MTNKDIKTILNYFNVLIEQGISTGDSTFIIEAIEQLQDLIKFHVDVLEEDDDE